MRRECLAGILGASTADSDFELRVRRSRGPESGLPVVLTEARQAPAPRTMPVDGGACDVRRECLAGILGASTAAPDFELSRGGLCHFRGRIISMVRG